MFRIPRILALAVVASGAALVAAPSQAQTAWPFKGVDFPKSDGWCVKRAQQGDNMAIELRHCGTDYPYLSATIVDPGQGEADWDIAEMTVRFADLMEGPEGGPTFASAIAGVYGDCEKTSLTVDRNPVPGVPGATVTASMSCSKVGQTQSISFRNFTSYVQTRSGVLWCVTFDYPDTDLSDDDKAVIRSAADAIAAAP